MVLFPLEVDEGWARGREGSAGWAEGAGASAEEGGHGGRLDGEGIPSLVVKASRRYAWTVVDNCSRYHLLRRSCASISMEWDSLMQSSEVLCGVSPDSRPRTYHTHRTSIAVGTSPTHYRYQPICRSPNACANSKPSSSQSDSAPAP